MRPSLLAGILLLAAAAPRVPGPAALPPAAAQEIPPAAPADPVAEARRLHDEAKEFFRTAGDTDLPQEGRRKARQEAYTRLQKAKDLLDGWLEKHPGDEQRLDALYSDIATTMFWLRKEGGVGEFGGAKPKPPEKAPPPAGPPPETPAGPAPPAEPAPPPPPSPAAVLAEIEAYAAAHRGDVPGQHERFSKFLADFPDRNSPEFAQAAKRLEDLDQRLKDVYRKARDEDPDALASVDEGEVGRLVDQLCGDLKDQDPEVRARAARFLGGLGSGKASPPLFAALGSERDAGVAAAEKEALAKIGGRRTCEMLAREKPTSPLAPAVLEILCMSIRRGGVNARIAGEFAADRARPFDEATRGEVAETLFQAGAEGAVGLSKIVDVVPAEKKVGYIEHLGTLRDPRSAGGLARFLVVNPQGARRAQHGAALDAIKAIGKPGVRYLIPMLDNKECQVWTAEVLRTLTGAKPKDDMRKTWEKWFRENRRLVEGR